jgi:hypothetical protein
MLPAEGAHLELPRAGDLPPEARPAPPPAKTD